MLGSPGGTGCDDVHFPIHGSWDGSDVRVTGMCVYVKEGTYEFCNLIHL
jgi:hypothetical protein